VASSSIRQSQRLGKTAAQNSAVEPSHGGDYSLSDATSLYQPDAVRAVMPSFAIHR